MGGGKYTHRFRRLSFPRLNSYFTGEGGWRAHISTSSWWKAMETKNLVHLTFSHHSYKNKRRYEHRVGWMFLSYSHPHRARLFPRSLSTHFKRLGDVDKAAPHLQTPPQKRDASQDQAFPPSRGTEARLLPLAPTAVFHKEKEPRRPNSLWRHLSSTCGLIQLQVEKCHKSKKWVRFCKSYLERWSWFSSNIRFLVSILLYLLKESLHNSPKCIIILTTSSWL